jgi:hypothetical protein
MPPLAPLDAPAAPSPREVAPELSELLEQPKAIITNDVHALERNRFTASSW